MSHAKNQRKRRAQRKRAKQALRRQEEAQRRLECHDLIIDFAPRNGGAFTLSLDGFQLLRSFNEALDQRR